MQLDAACFHCLLVASAQSKDPTEQQTFHTGIFLQNSPFPSHPRQFAFASSLKLFHFSVSARPTQSHRRSRPRYPSSAAMSSTTFGHNGLEACKNKEFEKAISLLDKALQDSKSPAWLLARAHAHTQLKDYDAALRDAELAYHSAAERGSGTSRKQMIEAQYRRAVIYNRLGRFADADCCCKWSMLLAEGRPANEKDGVEKNVDENGNYKVTYEEGLADRANQPRSEGIASIAAAGNKTGFEADWNRAYALRSQLLSKLKASPEDSPAYKVGVSKIPTKPTVKKEQEPSSESENEIKREDFQEPDEKLKLRTDFYQSSQDVSITLFVKDVKKEDLRVEIDKHEVRLGPVPRETALYIKAGDIKATSTFFLMDDIIPSESSWTVTPRKIELKLRKATPGVKWSRWGDEFIGAHFEGAAKETQAPAPAPKPKAAPIPERKKEASVEAAAPAYPTSSKSGPKDWDKLEVADDDDNNQDANSFFKNLYSGATPEQQRAMMKSFVESNGTALSTDWDDVKKRTVETVPPEGVVPKKWES
ncbi:SGS domain-containing protein [Immersiella caudata]|uniref:SGS domain-containing protein n=1 Tax=Immersiella caudata TaxID=314043 RepID=A0AA40BZA7_9PEZI|nr:SGS domain-containing protein [Immersiella caudata]